MDEQELLGIIDRNSAEEPTKLDLSGNGLTALPEEVWELSDLEELVLSGNQLPALPSDIGHLTNLKRLDLGGNELTALPNEVWELSDLEELNLGGNPLSVLPSDIGHLKNLKKLRIYGNELRALPDEVWELSGLEELNLGGNQLSALPPDIGRLTNLKRLRLYGNELTTLPDEMWELSGLEELDLDRNQLSALPPDIGGLANLKRLELVSNDLTALPDEMWELSGLEELVLSGNQLSELPSDIGRLTNLKRLELGSNDLTALPDELWDLTELEELNLSGNQLSTLPSDIDRLTNLKRLRLYGNELTTLPDEVWELSGLEELDIIGNQLPALPADIRRLKNLKKLHIYSNELRALPDEVWELSGLEELDISGNQLPALPADIRRLKNLKKLQIYSNELRALPDELWDLTGLEELYVGGHKLLALPSSIGRLKNLKGLSVVFCKLGALPDELWELTELRDLMLAHIQLTALPADIGRLTKLQSLVLDGNQLTSLPSEVGRLTKLWFLSLASNRLTSVPAGISQLTKLKWLRIGFNELSSLPPEIGRLTMAEWLSLPGNQLTALPADIGRLTNLTELDLRGNELGTLPDEVWKLTGLEELDLGENQLSALSSDVGRLTKLKKLDLANNELKMLPDEVWELTGLEELALGENQLSALSSHIGGLTNLKKLDLASNELKMLPDEVWELSHLQLLSLSRNQLMALPSSIGRLMNLKELSVASNELKVLPAAVCKLSDIEELDLSENQLSELSSDIGRLTNLKKLKLRDNQLTSLPDEVSRLTSLREFLLDRNQLQSLPPKLGHLDALRNLTLEGNSDLRLPPLGIAALGTVAAKRYLRAVLSGSEPVWTSKLLIVGEGGVGKTCLYNALNGRLFSEGYEDATVGIDIGPLELAHPQRPDVTMTLSCWDFAGQEFNHAVHQFFFSNRALFLLVWNARHGWQQGKLYRWLENIKVRAPRAKVLLVATHIDQPYAAYPKAELQRKYAQIAGVYEVSNVTGEGIDELREAVRIHAADLPLMGLQWPSTWVEAASVVRELQESGASYATRREVRARITRTGLEDDDATVLMRWLHELGEILHFEEEATLRDLVVIEPEWVTGHVAQVLRSDTVMANDGILTRAHLERNLWPDLDGHVREHLLRLMEEFDLAYLIPDDPEDRSLIVERTPLDPPEYHDAWDAFRGAGQELRLRYRLDSMQPGIPTWLIARCHRFSMGLHWLDGVLFEDEAGRHRALVVAEDRRNVVDMVVRGPFPQRFMSLLRDGFRDTLRRYEGLTVERYVPCPGYDELEEAPCTHEFDLDNLERWVERRPGLDEVVCPRCGESHSRLALVEGVGAPALTQDYTERRIIQVIERQSAVIREHVTREARMTREEVEEVGQQIEGMIAYTKRNFLLQWQREQKESLVTCPNLFTIRPLGKSGIFTAERYALQLYCQHDRGWHSVAPEGRYEFKQPREWWEKSLPYLRTMVKVMQIVVPLGARALDVAGDAATWAKDQHEIFENEFELFDQMLKGGEEVLPEEDAVEALGEELEAQDVFGKHTGADLVPIRDLMDALAEQDVEKGRLKWGGLTRVTKPEGEIVWLCAEHLAEFVSRWDLWGEPVA